MRRSNACTGLVTAAWAAIVPATATATATATTTATADVTIHVDAAAPEGGDGLAWATAHRYLQDALLGAAGVPGPVEVRVAQGVYRPDRDESGMVRLGDRHATFTLIDGVSVLGGYAGAGGPDPDARDVHAYETVLSGDLAGDDQAYFVNVDENSFHVVTARGTGPTAVLDGVTVRGGNTFGLDGGEFQEYLENGAGVFCWDGSPTLRNCTFTRCRAVRGGVIYANGETWYDGELQYVEVAPTIIDCLFTENYAVLNGGAVSLNVAGATVARTRFIWNESTGALGGGALSLRHPAIDGAPVVIHQCAFIGNVASTASGGAIRVVYVPTKIASTVFADNRAQVDGGGLHVSPLSWWTEVSGCTIAGNRAVAGNGGGLRITGLNTSLDDCLLWGNSHGGAIPHDECGQICGDPSLVVNNSCVQDWHGQYAGSNCIADDPLFRDPDGPDDDPLTWDDNDYRLGVGSPCIDAGDNGLVQPDLVDLDGDDDTAEPIPFDADGHPRFVDDPATPDTGIGTPPLVDLGAYEFNGLPCPGDLDGDGAVAVSDLTAVVLAWGTPGGDVTGDGTTDVLDLVAVINAWGPCE